MRPTTVTTVSRQRYDNVTICGLVNFNGHFCRHDNVTTGKTVMTESRWCHDGVTIASQLLSPPHSGDRGRYKKELDGHQNPQLCEYLRESLCDMDPSAILTDDNVRMLVLLCDLKMETIHTQTLLVKHIADLQKKKEGRGDQKATKEEIFVGAPVDSQENTVWSVGTLVAGTDLRRQDIVHQLPSS